MPEPELVQVSTKLPLQSLPKADVIQIVERSFQMEPARCEHVPLPPGDGDDSRPEESA